MVSFSWNRWLQRTVARLTKRKVRKAVVPHVRQVEGLEDRALLSATLPNAIDDPSYVVNEDQTLNGVSVLGNDTDDDGDTIDVAVLDADVSHGSLTLNQDGTFTYTPDLNFHGVDSFTYFAHDSLNNETSPTSATVTITVNPIADLDAIDDGFTTDEDTALSDSVATNDSTTSGGTLNYALDSQAANGVAVVNSDGSFTYTPNGNFHGSDSFTYQVTDADAGESAIRTVSITINSVVDLTAADDAFAVDEDLILSDSVATTDSTRSGGTLSYALDTQATHGTAIVNADGSFSYTPEADFHGTDSFTYTVTDADAGEALTQTVAITVNTINDAPVADALSVSTDEDTPYNGTLTGSDIEGDTLTFLLATPAAHGTATVNLDGTFSYAPAANFHGSDSFTFVVNDGTVDSAPVTVLITVDAVDDLTANTDSFATDEDLVLSDSVATNDSTTSGGTLSFALATQAGHGTAVLNADGSFTYTPDANFNGADSFTYTVSDADAGETLTRTVSITVNAVNDAPVADSLSFSTDEDVQYNGTLTGSDVDGDSPAFALTTPAAHGIVTLNLDGTFSYTPEANFHGSDSFMFVVNDGTVDSAAVTVLITVDAVDDLTANADSFSTDEDTALSDSVATNDSTTSGGILTYSLDSAASHGTAVVDADGSFTYTPIANFHGTDSFTYTVTDANAGETATRTVSITVISVADLAANDDAFVTDEDTPFSDSVATNDSTTSGGLLNYALQTQAGHGTVVVDADGSFTYTPNADFHGTDSFAYLVSDPASSETAIRTASITVNAINDTPVADSQTITTDEDTQFDGTLTATDIDGDSLLFILQTGAAHGTVTVNPDGTFSYVPEANFHGSDLFTFVVSDGTATSAAATVSITVTSVNDLPVAASVSISTDEDTPFAGTLTASDADGDALTFVLSTPAAHGTVSINADGTFSYTPDANFHGTDSFTFVVNDGQADSLPATVSITVVTVNDVPAADAQAVSIDEDTLYNGTLTGSDADGDALTFAIGTVLPSHGVVAINPDGTFSYTPAANFHGTDTFSFVASDGTANSTEALVTVTVAAVNDTPVANDGSFSGHKNSNVQGTLTATDVDGDGLTFSGGTVAPSHGTVVISPDGTFTYTPEANYFGPDTFSFVVSDGTATSVEATVTITIANNQAPVADPGNLQTNEDTPLSGTLTGSDADGDPLEFFLGSFVPLHGTVDITLDGTFVYTPSSNFHGTDSFTFYVNDGIGNSAEVTVTVSVLSVNDLPVASAASFNTNEDTPFSGTLTASDVDGDSLTFVAGSVAPSHGAVTINPDGTFTYTPNLNYHGSDTFTFKVNDGTADSAEATVTFTVGAVNDAPTVSNGAATINEDSSLNGSVSTLGLDVDGDPLTYVVVTPPAHGTLVLSPDGTFVYTPHANYNGPDSFTFKATDGQTDSNIGTFNITVSSIDDPLTLNLPGNGAVVARTSVPVQLDPGASVGDVDSNVNYANAQIRAFVASGQSASDAKNGRFTLSVLNQGTGTGLVKVKGSKIYFNGSKNAIATFSGGKKGKSLIITFNSAATAEAVNAVLKQLSVQASKKASPGTRTIGVRVVASNQIADATQTATVS